MDINGSVALVTGASGGLGREFVRQLLERGASTVYAGARKQVDWHDDRVVPLDLEVTDPQAVRAAADAARDLTLLVNNAGTTGARSLLDAPLEDIRQTFETNLFGPLGLVRAFAPVLAGNGGGAVVDVHSVLSWLATPGAYSPSKAAFWGLTNSLRLELAPQGTQVVGAQLGYTDTPMTAGLDVPKSDPADIVARILDALAAGADEVQADETAVNVRAALSTLTTGAFA
jgi:NAD(P)-dependent dehydrogenase (short-subunit alcohol dehydrogenase family)